MIRYKILKLLVIVIVILYPLFIYAQVDYSRYFYKDDYIDELIDEENQTLSDIVLANSVQRLLGNKFIFILGDYVLHSEYDMFGNLIMKGNLSVNFMRKKENNKFTETYGSSGGYSDLLKKAKNLLLERTLGLQVRQSGWTHTILGGRRIRMKFTPYTFKKFNLFGLMYDLEKGEDFLFRFFYTTRFRDIPNRMAEMNKFLTSDSMDNIMAATRMRIDIGGLFSRLPSIFEGQNIGATFIYKTLPNGGNSWRGIVREFVLDYWEDYEEGKNVIKSNANQFNSKEMLVGVDIEGKIATFNYAAEYVYDTGQNGHISPDYEEYSVIYDSSKAQAALVEFEITPEEFSDFAFTGALSSDDILNKRLENLKFAVDLRGWYIGKDFSAPWANDDDDDYDGWLDENDHYFDGSYPWEANDNGHMDEPRSGVIPLVYNENKNDSYDYEEDFLHFYSDRGFLQAPLFEDENYNGVLDYLEDDYDPQFPYDRNRKGFRYIVGISPMSIGVFFGGGVNNWVVSDNSKRTKVYLGGYGYEKKKLFDMIDIKAQYVFEWVQDTIPDNFVSLEDRETLIHDRLINKHNILNKVSFIISFTKFEDLTLAFKIRRTYNDAQDREFKNRYILDIFKLGYDIRLMKRERLVISPQYKYERFKNLFYGPGGVELFFDDYILIKHLREDYMSNTVILKMRFDIIDDIYIISGVQFRLFRDNYSNINSNKQLVIPIQLVMKGQKYSRGRFPSGKSNILGFTMGYKYILTLFDIGTRKSFEYFAKMIIPF